MNFDLMRLIAALLVVVSHTFPLAGEPPVRIWGVEDLGALGVSIFFVISGYLVTASYVRDPKSYLAKRILRIEPGLIASLVVTVVARPPAEYPLAAAGAGWLVTVSSVVCVATGAVLVSATLKV